jgi:DNA repair protein RecN (Recombination protein N)
MKTSHEAYESLYGGDEAVISHLNRNARNLREIALIDPQLTPFSEMLESVTIQIEDIAASLRDYSKKIHFDPQVLEEIDNRLETIHRLKRKYGETIEEILRYQKKIEAEMETISLRDDRIQALEGDYEKVSSEALTKAQGLSRKRKESALALSEKLEEELSSLGMKNTRFSVNIVQSESLEERVWIR